MKSKYTKKDGTKNESLSELIIGFRDYYGEDRIVTSFEMRDILSSQIVPQISFKSRIPSLDQAIDFFEGGELIIISGPRKSGKTLLAQTLTLSFLYQEVKSLWFSYELTPKQFLRCFRDLPFFVMPLKLRAYALDWIRDKIIEAVAKHGIGDVFIDHLHFLFDIARARNPSIEIGQVVRFLKSIATEMNIAIFLICHMTKIRTEKEPTDEDFRDSSFLAQESDAGLIIWRKKGTDNEAKLKVCYHRRTGVWERKINLRKINGLLMEATDEF